MIMRRNSQITNLIWSLLLLPPYIDEARGAFADRILQPQKRIWSIVSQKNCQQNLDGTLYSCRFPEIKITEPYSSLPPLPFETTVNVRTSLSCQLRGAEGYLDVRLADFDHQKTDGKFLSSETLSIHHSQMIKFQHPRNLGLGQISIYPKSRSIFSSIEFNPGCEISLEVDFNRLAVHSNDEGNKILNVLRNKIETLKEAQEALTIIDTFETNHSTLRNIKNLVLRHQLQMADMQDELSALFPQTQDDFETPVVAYIQTQTSNLEDIQALLIKLERGISKPSFEFLGNIKSKFLKYKTQLRELEQEFAEIAHALGSDSGCSKKMEFDAFCDGLRKVLEQEISGPHGVIDELKCAFRQIEKRK